MAVSTNSKVTRVQPVFSWLKDHGGPTWPAQLVQLAKGISHSPDCGPIRHIFLDPEKTVPATPSRLAWMLKNANRLTPQDGKLWNALNKRVSNASAVEAALALLEKEITRGISKELVLEGKTHADCLIECEHAFIWIEGKRFDWLSPSIKWDVFRDQLARNVEAVWSLASKQNKDYCMIICHEHPLKHHETLLLDGYRNGTWSGGWPHIPEDLRREFAKRIGTVTWSEIANHWPALRLLPELQDLGGG